MKSDAVRNELLMVPNILGISRGATPREIHILWTGVPHAQVVEVACGGIRVRSGCGMVWLRLK
jgi:hypothetical protein